MIVESEANEETSNFRTDDRLLFPHLGVQTVTRPLGLMSTVRENSRDIITVRVSNRNLLRWILSASEGSRSMGRLPTAGDVMCAHLHNKKDFEQASLPTAGTVSWTSTALETLHQLNEIRELSILQPKHRVFVFKPRSRPYQRLNGYVRPSTASGGFPGIGAGCARLG